MRKIEPHSRPLIFLGAGEHASVLLDLVRALGRAVYGVCDSRLGTERVADWRGVPVLGDDRVLETVSRDDFDVVNGLGVLPGKTQRHALSEKIRELGFRTPALVHPNAYVAGDALLEPGVQIMAGSVICTGASIGAATIVNTKSSVDHDCSIAADVHIAPGCTICGRVSIGRRSFVGAGTTVINGLSIGERVLIGAGSTVTQNLDDNSTIVARPVHDVARRTR